MRDAERDQTPHGFSEKGDGCVLKHEFRGLQVLAHDPHELVETGAVAHRDVQARELEILRKALELRGRRETGAVQTRDVHHARLRLGVPRRVIAARGHRGEEPGRPAGLSREQVVQSHALCLASALSRDALHEGVLARGARGGGRGGRRGARSCGRRRVVVRGERGRGRRGVDRGILVLGRRRGICDCSPSGPKPSGSRHRRRHRRRAGDAGGPAGDTDTRRERRRARRGGG